jgi:hypothetical protein
MNITEFLLARITEDEIAAHDLMGEREGDRTLAECAAKRAMLAKIPKASDEFDLLGGTSQYVLRALATVYSGHPDYDPEWTL